jgi:hypothetical protein
MLGFQDIGAFLAYALTVVAALLCVVYGIVNWNRPAPDEEAKEIDEELAWEKRDPDLKPAAPRKGGK